MDEARDLYKHSSARHRLRPRHSVRRLEMRTAVKFVLLCVLCAVCGKLANAVCVGTSVNAFGARGDGATDDTSAIQSAINAAAAAGGGSVVFNVARYFTT